MVIRSVLVITFLAGIACITGRATTGPSGQAEIDTWAGATVDELYLAYGTPSKSVGQVDGITAGSACNLTLGLPFQLQARRLSESHRSNLPTFLQR